VATNTRERIVTSTAELFKRQGYNGTGVKQIVAEASAPFGSLYHFFPGGKEELAAEVVRTSGALYGDLIDVFFQGPDTDLPTAVRLFFLAAADHLRETDYVDACPIATVALEVASTNDTLRRATQDVFEGWLARATERFVQCGVKKRTARELAIVAVIALEGAFILCRAARNTEALEVAAETVARTFAAATA
jgi:AcrR family transcriptional regulator